MPTAANSKIIVLGNEKGGTGKSTLAMHLAVYFMHAGKKVATIDLDGRQGTLSRYMDNRLQYSATDEGRAIQLPSHLSLNPLVLEDEARLSTGIEKLKADHDVVIIDTPGSYSKMNVSGHELADVLITPVNDSLVDVDVLAKINPETLEMQSPSHYAEVVWKARQQRASKGLKPLEWVVVRNRMSHLNNKNMSRMTTVLEFLSKRISFKNAPGIGERVLYRDLFLRGLTVLDRQAFSTSAVAAKSEIESLAGLCG